MIKGQTKMLLTQEVMRRRCLRATSKQYTPVCLNNKSTGLCWVLNGFRYLCAIALSFICSDMDD